MSFWSKLATSALVLLIGASVSILSVLNHGARLRYEVDHYPAASTPIYLAGVSEDRSRIALSTLEQFAALPGRAIVRVDHQASNVDGGLSGLRVGVATSGRKPPATLNFTFLGVSLFDTGTITKLVASGSAKSIGLDANSADQIAPIPSIAFAPRLSVVTLSHLVDTSGTINGTYRVVGATPVQVDQLLKSLTSATGESGQSMLAPLHGQETDDGLLPMILLGCTLAATILLLLVLVFEALRSFQVLGVHLLLGKSAWGCAARLFRPTLLTAAVTVPMSMVLIVVLAPGFRLSGALISAAWSSAIVGTLPVVVCVAIAATTIVSTKPVNAILGRYSKRVLLLVLAGFYVAAVAGFVFVLAFIDGPLNEASKLAGVRQSWSAVSTQQILYNLSPGNDEASVGGQSSQLAKDFYTWYRSIANRPGVALTHATLYDQQTLDQWKGVYKSVPQRPFWYIARVPQRAG